MSRSISLLQGPSLLVTRMIDQKAPNAVSLSSIPLSFGTASLSCLAAEHHQIHDQDSLDAWRTKAMQTIDDLYEQKAIHLKQEAHVNALLGQIRAVINDEMPRHASVYFGDDNQVQNMQMANNHHYKE
jgi:hypothetical protein